MGFLSASAGMVCFELSGTEAYQKNEQQLREKLATEGFRSIEQSAQELATGWVHFDDDEASDFSSAAGCVRDHYLCFALRQDRRKVPAALLKRHFSRLCEEFLGAHPGLQRVPKNQREQLRDQARESLLARTLPTPSVVHVVWDMQRNLVRFCSLGKNNIETFQGLFHQTFPGLRLRLLPPLQRAFAVLPDSLHGALRQADQAQSDSFLEQIEANRWLGADFLLWLFYRTLNSGSQYQVLTAGPLLEKQPFTAFLDDRLVLVGGGQEGQQKIVVAGPQDHFLEVKTALSQGKQIEEATLHVQQDEDRCWKLTLKGERFFFGGFTTPMIRPETTPEDDPGLEAEAAFLTKINAVEEGEQMFDSLFRTFLTVRLGGDWGRQLDAVNRWLKEL